MYQEDTVLIRSRRSGVATSRAWLASSTSGREIDLANHQMKTMDSTNNGMLCDRVTSIRPLRSLSVVSVGFCATMPHPVDATGA